MTLCGLKKIIYADVFWATKVLLLHFFENGHGLLSSLLAARRPFLPKRYHHEGVLSTQVTAGADLGKGHSPSEILKKK